mgnify:CR=1 FL=1
MLTVLCVDIDFDLTAYCFNDLFHFGVITGFIENSANLCLEITPSTGLCVIDHARFHTIEGCLTKIRYPKRNNKSIKNRYLIRLHPLTEIPATSL